MFKDNRGFSLVEIVVVMSIISILAVVGVAAISASRAQAKVAQTTTELNELKILMETYKTRKGEMPPLLKDYNPKNECSFPQTNTNNGCHTTGIWNWETRTLKDGLQVAGFLTEAKRVEYGTDSWGNPYAYDERYPTDFSILCSWGSDEVFETYWDEDVQGDDICVFFDK